MVNLFEQLLRNLFHWMYKQYATNALSTTLCCLYTELSIVLSITLILLYIFVAFKCGHSLQLLQYYFQEDRYINWRDFTYLLLRILMSMLQVKQLMNYLLSLAFFNFRKLENKRAYYFKVIFPPINGILVAFLLIVRRWPTPWSRRNARSAHGSRRRGIIRLVSVVVMKRSGNSAVGKAWYWLGEGVSHGSHRSPSPVQVVQGARTMTTVHRRVHRQFTVVL